MAIKAYGWPPLSQSREFWSAIAGAVVGGLIAFGIQMIVLHDARKQRKEDHKRVQQGLANSLLLKMIRITSSFRYINYHMTEAYKREEAGAEPWQFVQPIISQTPPIKFTAEELGMLLAQKDDDVFNAIAALDDIHNALIGVLEQHMIHRQDLMQRLPPPQAVEGEVGSGVYTADQKRALALYTINVNVLAESARDMAAKGAEQSDKALDHLHALLKARGLVSYDLQNKPLPGQEPYNLGA